MLKTMRITNTKWLDGDGSLLWSFAVLFLGALPWLLPTRTPPWPAFYAETLTASAAIIFGLWVTSLKGVDSGGVCKLGIDSTALVLMTLAAVPLGQALLGLLAYGHEAFAASAYLAAIALTVIGSRQAQTLAPWRLIEAVWSSLIIASTVSVGVALCQWLQVDAWGFFAPPPTNAGRADANVGQPNNLSTLLCWGLVGLWWGWRRSHMRGSIAAVAAVYFIVGIVLTQSRTAWPTCIGLVLAAVCGRRYLAPGRSFFAFIALGLWFMAATLAASSVTTALSLTSARPMSELSTAGLRPVIWQVALQAALDRPWAGFGWGQFLVAWVEKAPALLPYPQLVSYAHNVVLDGLVWVGLPIALAFFVCVGVWVWRRCRAAQSAEQWLLLVGLGVLSVHAMLELPHAYTFFLLPAAAMVGTLNALGSKPPALRVPRACFGVAVLCMAFLLVVFVRDYREIESHFLSQRLYEARIGTATSPPKPPSPKVLRWMIDADEQLRMTAHEGMSKPQLLRWRATLERHPLVGSLYRYAQANAMSQDAAEAAWALNTICTLHPRHLCESALSDWNAFATQYPAAAAVQRPNALLVN